jgi:hypothetical protein
MPHQAIRRIALAIALAVLPGMAGVVSAAGSQAGDDGQQPIGADNEGPRQALPNATYPSYGYRQEMVEGHPPYLTYYYTSPPVTDEYSPTWRGYYRYAYPGDTSGRNTNTSPRCAPLTGAAYSDCLHGAAPGGD